MTELITKLFTEYTLQTIGTFGIVLAIILRLFGKNKKSKI